jgi:hypothetical protein
METILKIRRRESQVYYPLLPLRRLDLRWRAGTSLEKHGFEDGTGMLDVAHWAEETDIQSILLLALQIDEEVQSLCKKVDGRHLELEARIERHKSKVKAQI